MADISTQLNAIMNAVYGEEVRGSIHDAIDLINKVGEKVITIGTAVVDEDSSISGYYDESLYLNSSTSILWKCDGEKWVNMGTFKGADGEDGTDGASLTATSSKSGKITTVTISNASTGEVVNTFQVRDGADGSGGGGASSWDDLTDKPFEALGDDFTTDASSNLVLSSANIQKLSNFDNTTNKLKDSALSDTVTKKLTEITQRFMLGTLPSGYNMLGEWQSGEESDWRKTDDDGNDTFVWSEYFYEDDTKDEMLSFDFYYDTKCNQPIFLGGYQWWNDDTTHKGGLNILLGNVPDSDVDVWVQVKRTIEEDA